MLLKPNDKSCKESTFLIRTLVSVDNMLAADTFCGKHTRGLVELRGRVELASFVLDINGGVTIASNIKTRTHRLMISSRVT